jgi:hypothetical protein
MLAFFMPGPIELIIISIVVAVPVAIVVALVVTQRARKASGPNPKLTPCPDCGRFVSPRATTCPQCGCPLQT